MAPHLPPPSLRWCLCPPPSPSLDLTVVGPPCTRTPPALLARQAAIVVVWPLCSTVHRFGLQHPCGSFAPRWHVYHWVRGGRRGLLLLRDPPLHCWCNAPCSLHIIIISRCGCSCSTCTPSWHSSLHRAPRGTRPAGCCTADRPGGGECGALLCEANQPHSPQHSTRHTHHTTGHTCSSAHSGCVNSTPPASCSSARLACCKSLPCR